MYISSHLFSLKSGLYHNLKKKKLTGFNRVIRIFIFLFGSLCKKE